MQGMGKIKIAPSILAADFSCLLEEIKKIEEEADLLHIDIMDGHFVPNITFGPEVLRLLKKEVHLPFDVHLMVEYPERWIEPFREIGCESLTIHVEAAVHLDRVVGLIKSNGMKSGVALNPATPVCFLDYVLSKLDTVLLMTVNPGFGAQSFIPEVLPKIQTMRAIIEKKNLNLDIAVDGGINENTAFQVIEKGASILIMGTSIFGNTDPRKAIINLKSKIEGRKEDTGGSHPFVENGSK